MGAPVWMLWTVMIADAKSPKAPKGSPPASAPSAEVQAAFGEFEAAATAWQHALAEARTYPVQELVWSSSAGEAFQGRLDALGAEVEAAEQVLMDANRGVGLAAQAGDAAGVRAAAAPLTGRLGEVSALAAKVEALRVEVAAATAPPSSVAVAELASMSWTDLQRYFATKGWARPGAAVGVMTMGAYESGNFEVEDGGGVLVLTVVRPASTPVDGGGARATPPADLAARAASEGRAFLFAATADVYVEIAPRERATPEQAKSLLAAAITP